MSRYNNRKQAEAHVLERLNQRRPAQQARGYRSREDLGLPPIVEGEVMPAQTMTVQPMPAAQPIGQQRQPRVVEMLKGTHKDRAEAFVIRTRMIAWMTAAATALMWFLVRWALPLTTGKTTAGVLLVGTFSILAGLFAFLAVWMAAYVFDMATSPGGIGLFEAWRTQRRIDAQSSAMVDAYRKAHGVDYE